MPVMDGCEATRQIRNCGRADAQTIPIIATTANAFAEDVSAVLTAGMDAHAGKPLDIKELCTLPVSYTHLDVYKRQVNVPQQPH